jgi:hypothetical protein
MSLTARRATSRVGSHHLDHVGEPGEIRAVSEVARLPALEFPSARRDYMKNFHRTLLRKAAG